MRSTCKRGSGGGTAADGRRLERAGAQVCASERTLNNHAGTGGGRGVEVAALSEGKVFLRQNKQGGLNVLGEL